MPDPDTRKIAADIYKCLLRDRWQERSTDIAEVHCKQYAEKAINFAAAFEKVYESSPIDK